MLWRRAAYKNSQAGRGLRLLAGAQQASALSDLTGRAALHP